MLLSRRDGALVGRVAELAAVGRLVDAARNGAGCVLLVAGEAGIGKSRLLAEATRLARERDLVVLTGRAVEGGGAYRPVAEALLGFLRDGRVTDSAALRPYRPALGRLVPDYARPDHGATGGLADGTSAPSIDPALVLGEGLLRLLSTVGGHRGCLLLLEDLHWADADTLALVEYLAGAVRSVPVLVAVSASLSRFLCATVRCPDLQGVVR